MYYSDKRIVHKMMQQNINSILILYAVRSVQYSGATSDFWRCVDL